MKAKLLPWIWIWVVSAWLMQSLTAQQPRVSKESFHSVTKGITLQELTKIFGTNKLHQFSIINEEKKLHCISYSFEEPFIYYYFIFEEKRLIKICSPPKFDVKILQKANKRIEVREPVDPLVRIKDTLAQKPMTGSEVYSEIRSRLQRLRKGEDNNICPAFLITSPLLYASFMIHAPAQRAEYRKNDELAQKFDASKVKLGAPFSTAIEAFGAPSSGPTGEKTCWKGPPLKKVKREHLYSPICLTEKEGIITGIYSNDFVTEQR